MENDDMAKEMFEFSMNLLENRRNTFQDWPFDQDDGCTPDKLAEAGFYHIPTDQEPDLVRCFMCRKELDGWEPDDDPWKEHESHAGHCPFLSMKRNDDEITLEEFLKSEATRQTQRLMKIAESTISDIEKYSQKTREEMENLV